MSFITAAKTLFKSRSGKRVILLPSLILVISIFGLVSYVINFQTHLVESSALESARLYSQALTEFRTIYTANVVNRVNPHPDIKVSHDYQAQQYAIPLPATLSMELGERIGTHLSGAETWLYSDYPFPWRLAEGGGLRDEFSRRAWQTLNQKPIEAYYEFVADYKGRPVLRFATADLMRPACIDCHNHHPQSPKTDWQENDVRGVLEIVHPMASIFAKTEKGKQGLVILTTGISLFGVLSLFFVIRGYQKLNQDLERQVLERTQHLKLAKDKAIAASQEALLAHESLLKAKKETEKFQKRLVESNKMASLGAMSSGIAHELNQPLGAILLKSQLIQKFIDKDKYDKVKATNDAIIGQVLRAKKIMDALRVFSREDTGLEKQNCSVNQLIEEVSLLFYDEFKLNQIVLKLNLCEPAPVICVSSVQLSQVLANLLTNARDAVDDRQPKKITISCEVANERVYIRVSDNGCGIPQPIISKIFEPFYTTKAVDKGTGLGLSLSYSMVKNNGGEIRVESEQDKGTTFKLIFPIASGEDDE